MVALSLAKKNVTRKQERSLLTIIGVILAVGSFVALLSVAEGLYQRLRLEIYGRNIDIYVLPPSTIPLPTGPIGAIGYSSDLIHVIQPVKINPKSGATKSINILDFFNSSQADTGSDGKNSKDKAQAQDRSFPEFKKIDNIKKAIGVTRFQESIKGKTIILWGIPFDKTYYPEQNFLKTFFSNFEIAQGMVPIPAESPVDPYCTSEPRSLSELRDEDQTIIMGEKLADELKLGNGAEIPVKRGQNTIKLRVGCIGKFNIGFQDYFCFMPIQTALTIEESPGKVKEIWIQLVDKSKVNETKAQIIEMFPDLSVKTNEEYLGASSEIVKYAWLLQFAIALIGILIATTASMNTMLMSTFERIKEFGALRAIGATRFTIIIMILVESLILSVTGGIFGIIVGLLGSKFLDGAVMALFQTSFPLAHITLNLIIYAFVLSFFIGIIGALIPAVIIYRMDVIRALRWE